VVVPGLVLGISKIATTPPMAAADFSARTMALSMMYGRVAEAEEVPFLDIHGPLAADARYAADLADGVHPGAAGYEMLARQVAGWDAWRAWLAQARDAAS